MGRTSYSTAPSRLLDRLARSYGNKNESRLASRKRSYRTNSPGGAGYSSLHAQWHTTVLCRPAGTWRRGMRKEKEKASRLRQLANSWPAGLERRLGPLVIVFRVERLQLFIDEFVEIVLRNAQTMEGINKKQRQPLWICSNPSPSHHEMLTCIPYHTRTVRVH
jgi:hypothetical protein